MKGPVLDLPLVAIGSCRGDPNNVDIAAATEKGIPVLRAPGRNADAVAEMAVGAALRGEPRRRAGRPRRPGGRDLPRRHHPLPALPGLAARGPDRRASSGYGAVGRAAAWRFAGLGMKVISYDPFAPDATHSLDDLLAEADVVSMHAAVTPEIARDDRRRAVRRA